MSVNQTSARPRPRTTLVWLGLLAVGLIVLAVSGLVLVLHHSSSAGGGLETNPALDPGTPLSGPAPDFTLSDESGRPVSLHAFRGRVVILAFNDSECTTICPLTTSAMVQAKAMLGPAANRVQLLGIDANPDAIAVRNVRAYSEAHGMLHQWRFLTGSLPQLKRVWQAYHVGVAIEGGQIDHTPALFVIDPRGRLAKLYMTQLAYAAVPQLGQLLAREASRLLPRHPLVQSRLPYTHISGLGPRQIVSVPRVGGGQVTLGADGAPRLYLFFASWDQQVMDLRRQLASLAAYEDTARATRLPRLTAVDEASVEPSPPAVERYLSALPRALPYPVAVDRSGRIADGYEAQDEPWLVLTSGEGRLLWYYDVSTAGLIRAGKLVRQVRAALAHAPHAPANAAALQQQLAGSPAPLAALHEQADRVLGGAPALAARIHSLKGYPVVVNVWGSWCAPCVSEFGLLSSSSGRYGRQVAFLGADVGDSASDGQAFLSQHPVSYPSYQSSTADLVKIVPQGVAATPTTIFFNRGGKLAYVHTGQYVTQGSLDNDIAQYALGG